MDQSNDLVRELLWGTPITLLLFVLVFNVIREFRRVPSEAGKSSDEKIMLSRRVYVVVPSRPIVLMSLGMESIQSVRLSLHDAREIFKMMKLCSEMRELREGEFGELTWKIDGRSRSPDQKTMVVHFSGPQGWTREVVDRSAVNAAVTKFTNDVGL